MSSAAFAFQMQSANFGVDEASGLHKFWYWQMNADEKNKDSTVFHVIHCTLLSTEAYCSWTQKQPNVVVEYTC